MGEILFAGAEVIAYLSDYFPDEEMVGMLRPNTSSCSNTATAPSWEEEVINTTVRLPGKRKLLIMGQPFTVRRCISTDIRTIEGVRSMYITFSVRNSLCVTAKYIWSDVAGEDDCNLTLLGIFIRCLFKISNDLKTRKTEPAIKYLRAGNPFNKIQSFHPAAFGDVSYCCLWIYLHVETNIESH